MINEHRYQPSPGGTILKASESLNIQDVADKDIFESLKLPPIRYPKLREKRFKFEVCRKTLPEHCTPRDHIFNIPNQYGPVREMMKESQPQERKITVDVMKTIDHAIHKYSRTPSINSNQLIEDLKKETWEHKKKLPLMRENASSENIAMKHICNTVLNNEKTFVKALDETIENSDMLNLRRKEVRFKKWQENVFVPVSKAVSATMDREHREFRTKKQRIFRDYLTLSNRQLVSYLDIDYSATGYVGNRVYGPSGFGQRMKARTGRIQDPVHSCGIRRDHEDRTVVRCETGYTPTDEELVRRRYPRPTLPYVPLGRNNPPSDPNSWLMMKFSDINAAASIPWQLRKRYITPKQLESSVELSHLPAQMTREEIAQELAIPIRRRFVALMNRSANIEKLITMSNPTAPRREVEKELEEQH